MESQRIGRDWATQHRTLKRRWYLDNNFKKILKYVTRKTQNRSTCWSFKSWRQFHPRFDFNEVRIINVISQATFTRHNYCIGPHSQLRLSSKCYKEGWSKPVLMHCSEKYSEYPITWKDKILACPLRKRQKIYELIYLYILIRVCS